MPTLFQVLQLLIGAPLVLLFLYAAARLVSAAYFTSKQQFDRPRNTNQE